MCSFRTQAQRMASAGAPAPAAWVLLAACPVPAPIADAPISAFHVLPFETEGPVDRPDFVGSAIAELLARNLEPVPALRAVGASTTIESATATLTGGFRHGQDQSCLEVLARLPGRDEPL